LTILAGLLLGAWMVSLVTAAEDGLSPSATWAFLATWPTGWSGIGLEIVRVTLGWAVLGTVVAGGHLLLIWLSAGLSARTPRYSVQTRSMAAGVIGSILTLCIGMKCDTDRPWPHPPTTNDAAPLLAFLGLSAVILICGALLCGTEPTGRRGARRRFWLVNAAVASAGCSTAILYLCTWDAPTFVCGDWSGDARAPGFALTLSSSGAGSVAETAGATRIPVSWTASRNRLLIYESPENRHTTLVAEGTLSRDARSLTLQLVGRRPGSLVLAHAYVPDDSVDGDS
jgi:hypothetical protein